MDLATALDEALRDRYPIREPKTPVTQRRGLTARMNALEKEFTQKGDRRGAAGRRAAKAAGIHPDTWTRWKNAQRKPGAASLRKLEAAFTRLVTVPAFRRRLKDPRQVPNRVKVTATIKWSSSPQKNYNRRQHRTTILESMRPAMVRVIRAWVAAGPEAAAEALETGAAAVYRADEIRFEGDSVVVEFPEGEH